MVANVDATPVGKVAAKAVPYRAVFVYELSGDAWMLVQAQFAYGST